MGADDLGIDGFQVVIGDCHFSGLIAAQIIGDRIGFFDQRLKLRPAFRALDLQRDRRFAARESLIELAVLFAQKIGAGGTADIAPHAGRFDLDHLCPKVRQQHGAIRPCAILFNRQDFDAFEGEVSRLHQG